MVKVIITTLFVCLLLGCKIPYTENKYICNNGFTTDWGTRVYLRAGSNIIMYGDNRYAIPDGVICTISTREITGE